MPAVSLPLELPSWINCLEAVEAGAATPLQRFIADNEPAASDLRDAFRAELAAVLASAEPTRDPGSPTD